MKKLTTDGLGAARPRRLRVVGESLFASCDDGRIYRWSVPEERWEVARGVTTINLAPDDDDN